MNATQAAGITDRTTFLIVSDHGFKAFTKQVRANLALEAAGLGDKAQVLPEGGTAFVYVSENGLLPKVRAALTGVEGIDRVIGVDEFPALGLPTPDQDPQFGQLLLAAKTGYSFSSSKGAPVTAEAPQTGGSHGYLASDPEMNPIFIVSGYRVAARGKWNGISNLDIAPTIARLLGVTLPLAKGRLVAGIE